MSRMTILTAAELRTLVTLDLDAVSCIENAFRALATLPVAMPPILRLEIHELDPEKIEPIAGYQMIFSGTPWCCDRDALDDGRKPGPMSIGADKLQRVTKVAKIGGERRHFARSSAPVNIFGHNAPIDPCFRRSRKAIRVDSRDEAQESPIAFPPRLTGCWCKVRAIAVFIKPVSYLERRLPTTSIRGWPVCK